MPPFYEVTVAVFIKYLTNLLALIRKARLHAKHKRFDPEILFSARLAPDMYTLAQQVQYMYFMTLEAVSKLTGRKEPKFSYDEKTLADLEKSVKRAIAFLKTIKPKHFEGVEQKKIETFLAPGELFASKKYVTALALPNFFFHYTTAYDILRHNGVPVGKDDFLGL